MSNSRAKMSVFELTLLTAINMMGSGIVMLPTKLAEVGTISILSWLVTAVGSLCLAYAFAKCGMFSKRPGMGGYSEYAFGKSGNFMANYTYGVSLLFANIAIAITCVGYGASFLEVDLSPIQVCISDSSLHRHDRGSLGLHGVQFLGREHHGQIERRGGLVRDYSGVGALCHRLVLV